MKKELEQFLQENINKDVKGLNALSAVKVLEKNYELYDEYFFEYFKAIKKKNDHGNNVLDVGCGVGNISTKLHSLGFNVVGVDYLKEAINIAKKDATGVDFQVANVYNLPFPNEKFDVIVCLGVFQTVAEPEKALIELFRVLKKEGIIILRTINSISITSFKVKRHQFFTLYNPFKLKKMLKEAGGYNVEVKGIYLMPKSLEYIQEIILSSKIYKALNFLFPLTCFLSHSFYIQAYKKAGKRDFF